jgi:hypothetical protein
LHLLADERTPTLGTGSIAGAAYAAAPGRARPGPEHTGQRRGSIA